MPSTYYAFHEAEYAKRLRAGRAGWDAGDYDDFFVRPFVARSLQRSATCRPGNRALDLGCGTGALSCQLAEVGLDVTGIDISPSAIAAAQAVAARRRLPITFAVHDVCRSPSAGRSPGCTPGAPTQEARDRAKGHLGSGPE